MRVIKEKIKLVKKQALLSLAVALGIFILAISTNVALAEWREPSSPPPVEQFYAPLTIGGESQAKPGYILLDPEYSPTQESSLIYDPQRPLDVRGAGAKISTPYLYSDLVAVDTDTLYIDSSNDWVGIGTTIQSTGVKLKVADGTVQVGTSSSMISGRAVSGYGQDATIEFGTGGIVSDVDNSRYARAIAIDSQYMYTVGVEDDTAGWYIEKRSLLTGELDTNFGDDCSSGTCTRTYNGIVLSDDSAPYGSYIANDIAIDSQYMYIVGRTAISAVGQEIVWRIEKRSLLTGELDTSFGYNCHDGPTLCTPTNDGIILGEYYDSSASEALAIAIDGNYMYVAGWHGSDGSGRIEKRSLSNGALDATFATNGVMYGGEYGYNVAKYNDIKIDTSTGYMYIVGPTYSPVVSRVEKRLLSDGSLDTIFGDDCTSGSCNGPTGTGYVLSYSGSSVEAVAIDSQYMYMAGGDSSGNWRIEKRRLSDGTLCTSSSQCSGSGFGYDSTGTYTGNGVVLGDTNSSIAYGIVIDATFMYVVGSDDAAGGYDWWIEKRSLSDGALDTSFGNNGTVQVVDGERAYDVAIDSAGYIYVVGWNSGSDRRIEKRQIISGMLNNSLSAGIGIYGDAGSTGSAGVYGYRSANDGWGVYGSSQENVGVKGESDSGYGIYAETNDITNAAVYGQNTSDGWAGYFDGRLGAVADMVAKVFLPTSLQRSLIPFTSGQEIGEYDFGTWSSGAPSDSVVAFDGTYIWLGTNSPDSNSNNLFKIRASDNKVVQFYSRLLFGGCWGYAGIAFDGTYIWLTCNNSGSVYRFNPNDESVDSVAFSSGICTGGFCSNGPGFACTLDSDCVSANPNSNTDITVSFDNNQSYIWVANRNDNRIYKVNTNDLSYTFYNLDTLISGVTGVYKLTYDGEYLWVVAFDSQHIVRLWAEDPTDVDYPAIAVDTTTVDYDCPPYNVLFDGVYIWCTPGSGTNELVRIWAENPYDPSHPIKGYGSFTNHIKDATFDGTYLWFVSLGENKLYRLLAADPSQSTSYNLFTGPVRIVFDGTYLWIPETTGGAAPAVPKLHKYYSGTGLGHTDLNTVVNLRNVVGSCRNPSDPSSSSNNQCLFDWHCPTASAAPPSGLEGIVTGSDETAVFNDIALDATNMYVVGRTDNSDWYIEKRDKAAADFDAAFDGTSGEDANYPGDGYIIDGSAGSEAKALAIDSSYMYIAGSSDSSRWQIEKRRLDTGVLCSAAECGTVFGGAGSNPDGVVIGASQTQVAHDIAIDTTYMYVVGEDSSSNIRIEKRDLLTGSLDTTFNGSGIITTSYSTTSGGVAIDSDYIYVVGSSSGGRILKYDQVTGAADSGFGSGGVVTSAIDTLNDIVLDTTNGYLYVAGYCGSPSSDFCIGKYDLAQGNPDNSFGTNGVITGAVDSYQAHGITIDATNGYIYVVGSEIISSDTNWRIEKYNLSGNLDTSFGTSGVVNGDTKTDTARSIAIDSTYLYVVGEDFNAAGRVEKRSLTDGTPDSNFSKAGFGHNDGASGGYVIGKDGSDAYGIAIDATNGFMYVVGTEWPNNWLTEKRYLSDGALTFDFTQDDSGNNTDGRVASDNQSRRAHDVVYNSGYIYTVGGDANANWRIEKRRSSDALLETTFDTDGIVIGHPDSRVDGGTEGVDIAVDDNYIYTAGSEFEITPNNYYCHIEKHDKITGILDAGFGSGGILSDEQGLCGGNAGSFLFDIAIDDSFLYVVGDGPSGNNWQIEKRYLSDGSVDAGFGSGGLISVNFTYSPKSVVHDGTYMYVAGGTRLEKRLLSDGSLASDFGTGGTVDLSADFRVNAVAIDVNNIYLVGYDVTTGVWRIEKYAIDSGSLDTDFGTNGILTSVDGEAYSIGLDSTYMYVTGAQPGTNLWRVEKRCLSDGSYNCTAGPISVDEQCSVSNTNQTSNPSNPTQIGNINVAGSAELKNFHCYEPSTGEHQYATICLTDTDCTSALGAGWQCAGGDVRVEADIDAVNNQWGGSDETVAISGGTATCATDGYFIKGITLDASSQLSEIICRGL